LQRPRNGDFCEYIASAHEPWTEFVGVLMPELSGMASLSEKLVRPNSSAWSSPTMFWSAVVIIPTIAVIVARIARIDINHWGFMRGEKEG
jgi:hypothetical protein